MKFKMIVKFIVLNLILGGLTLPVVLIGLYLLSGGLAIGYSKGISSSDLITGWVMLVFGVTIFILSNFILWRSFGKKE